MAFGVSLPPIVGFILSYSGHGEFASHLNTGYAILQLSPLLLFGFFAEKFARRKPVQKISITKPLTFFTAMSVLMFFVTQHGYWLLIPLGALASGINFTGVRLVIHGLDLAWARLQVLKPTLFFFSSLAIYFVARDILQLKIPIIYFVCLSAVAPAIYGVCLLPRWAERISFQDIVKNSHLDIKAAISTVTPIYLSYYERLFSFGYHQSARYYAILAAAGILVFVFDVVNRLLIHKLYKTKLPSAQAWYGVHIGGLMGAGSGLVCGGLIFASQYYQIESYEIFIILSFLFLGSSFPMQSSIYALGQNRLLVYVNAVLILVLSATALTQSSESSILLILFIASLLRYFAMQCILLKTITTRV